MNKRLLLNEQTPRTRMSGLRYGVLSALLFLCAALALPVSASSLLWGLSVGDNINPVGVTSAGITYYPAIEVPEVMAQAMKGDKVTRIDVGFAQGSNKILDVFLTYDLNEEPFYTQEAVIKVNRYNEVTLTTPYIIEGRKFYVGYKYRAGTSRNPVGFDGNKIGGSSTFANLGLQPDGVDAIEWSDQSQFGNLCLRALIEGDNFPAAAAVPCGMTIPKSSPVNEKFSVALDFHNFSAVSVKSVEVTVTVGENTTTSTVTLPTEVATGDNGTITFDAIGVKEEADTPVNVRITKVNGEANVLADERNKSTILISDFSFPRIVVIEKLTGQGCGYCPRGIAAFELLQEKYPDTFLGIEVHNYQSREAFYCPSYMQWSDMYAGGAPSGSINRDPSIPALTMLPAQTEQYFLERSGFVNMRFNANAWFGDASKKDIRVETSFASGENLDNIDYAIALVLTEDGLKGSQSNNYAGGGLGAMNGMESKSNPFEYTYHNVALEIFDWQGADGSVPATLAARETSKYERTITVPEAVLRDQTVHNLKNLKVHALLIDRKTGEILTAASSPVTDTNSIESVEGDKTAPVIVSVAGGISARNADSMTVYTVDGRVVYQGVAAEVSVPAGIYVVRAASGASVVTSKIAVR